MQICKYQKYKVWFREGAKTAIHVFAILHFLSTRANPTLLHIWFNNPIRIITHDIFDIENIDIRLTCDFFQIHMETNIAEWVRQDKNTLIKLVLFVKSLFSPSYTADTFLTNPVFLLWSFWTWTMPPQLFCNHDWCAFNCWSLFQLVHRLQRVLGQRFTLLTKISADWALNNCCPECIFGRFG